MLRRSYYWRCVAIIALVIVIAISLPKIKNFPSNPMYNYASLKIDGHDIQTTKEATVNVAEVKTPIEIDTNITSNEGAKTVNTVAGTSNVVQLVANEIKQMVSLSTERLKENDNNLGTVKMNDDLPSLDETVLLPSTLVKLKEKLRCYDRSLESKITRRGDFWVYINYIRAEHGPIACHENITLTTHSDFTFLDNLNPMIERSVLDLIPCGVFQDVPDKLSPVITELIWSK